MYTENYLKKAFPVNGLSEQQLIFCGFENQELASKKRNNVFERIKSNDIQSKLDIVDYIELQNRKMPSFKPKYFVNENDVVGYVNPFCKHCHSHKLVKWNYTTRKLITNDFNGEIKIQRYKCNRCGKTFQTEFEGQFEPYCNFSEELKNKAIKTKELNWSSLRDISEYYQIFNGINISYETVRKSLIVIEGNQIQYDVPKTSGYYGYDAQWVKIEKEWKYRHVLFDLVQEIPIAELFTDEDNDEIVYQFINENTEQRNRIAIVTDLKTGYGKVMHQLKFKKHQYCIFHFKLAISKLIRDYLRELRREMARQLKEINKNASQKYIYAEVEKIVKSEKNEIKYALQLLYYLFKEKTWNKVLSYIELIKANLNTFPEFLREYLKKNFLPRYKSFLYYLEKPHKGKLTHTNNKTEGYFRGTMPKAYKRKYRTLEGIINQIYHKGNGWIKNKRKDENIRKFY